MNTFEKAMVGVLFALLLAWGYIQRTTMSTRPHPGAAQGTNAVAAAAAGTNAPSAAATNAAPAVAAAPAFSTNPPAATAVLTRPSRRPEQTAVLTNAVIEVTLSSWGGGIASVRLLNYPATIKRDGATVLLDFSDRPALALEGHPGLSADSDFDLETLPGGTSAVFSATAPDGVRLRRTLQLGADYRLRLADTFTAPTGSVAVLPPSGLYAGRVQAGKGDSQKGMSYLGLDTGPDAASQDVMHWSKKRLPALFGQQSSGFSCLSRSAPVNMPAQVTDKAGAPVAWTALKTKFFTQILTPETAAEDCVLRAARRMEGAQGLELSEISAVLRMPAQKLQPGESVTRRAQYYAGPKKYDQIKQLGLRQIEIMEFAWQSGWWVWFREVCALLLWTLNAIHRFIPNYGVAIILLTVIVKILFWPLTHKSTESAKKMQQIQPLLAPLREKFKDQPQKMQQAQMALYKEHGVNPMASCLPMLVQMPIFIALFTVLRSAVELRFAGFLWVPDLSEPEGLLAGILPLPLNILPLIMTVTMVIQQKLTPAAGDPQQQKMMLVIMPVMMLFMLYNMASGLMLYWSVSQILSIVQLLHQRRLGQAPGGTAAAVQPAAAAARKR
jgi:YidC/Oxa1 family membrane protein insertase